MGIQGGMSVSENAISDTAPNPAQDRVIRVFISSTFRDMHAERDHLVTVVFPELRERVEQLDLEFFDVNLQWGGYFDNIAAINLETVRLSDSNAQLTRPNSHVYFVPCRVYRQRQNPVRQACAPLGAAGRLVLVYAFSRSSQRKSRI